ncbi:MAG: diguanylate cyclase [Desulfotomaculales bacterium]
MPKKKKKPPGRVFAFLAGFLIVCALVVIFTAKQLKAAGENLHRLSTQLDKVVTATHLQQGLLTQSYHLRGYLLYRNPHDLQQFRLYSRQNQEELAGLLEIVRPARKPLVERIADLQFRYTQLCEREIIPKAGQGDLAGALEAVSQTGALNIFEESLTLAKELESLRVEDTRALFDQVVVQTKKSLIWGFSFVAAAALAFALGGLFLTGRAAMENRVFRLVLAATKNAIVVVRKNGRLQFFNRVAEEIFGLGRNQVVGRRFEEVFTGRDRPGEISFSFPVQKVLSTGDGLCNQEGIFVDKEGWRFVLQVDCLPLKDDGSVAGAVLLARDVTEEKVVEERLKGMAVRDAMTGLYNHSYLKQVLAREIERAACRGGLVSFAILDVDSFKYYNDSFGHQAGDDALKKVARLIQESVRGDDVVARYGGDEFAVVLPGADHGAAAEVAERIRKNIENFPFAYREYMPGGRVTVSAGVACYPLQAKSASELVKMADEALYRVKRTTKNRVEIYSSVLEEIVAAGHVDRRTAPQVGTLLTAMKAKDPYTYAHCENVARYALTLAKRAGLSPEEISRIRVAALLHDLGKVEIPLEVLTKTDPLTPEEWALIRKHTVAGADLVAQVKPLAALAPVILYHHERYDGTGYPAGLAGEDIPLGARIIALADAFDAMTSYRPYRPARTPFEALQEIKRQAGSQFDPVLAELFLKIIKEKEGLPCLKGA